MTDENEKDKRKKIIILIFMASPLCGALIFGILGALVGLIGDSFTPLSGFLWGLVVGVLVVVISGAGVLSWEWIKKEAIKGRVLPYMLCGIGAAIAISGIFAINLGRPSCEEQGDAPYSNCVTYANDGFEATSTQRWHKFWGALPIAVIICLLIAFIAHNQVEKNRPKHFKSDEDRFTVGIFPETISVKMHKDGNNYKYAIEGVVEYAIYAIPLDERLKSQREIQETIESSHKETVSSALGIDVDKIQYSKGSKQGSPYVYGSYPIRKDFSCYYLTLAKYGKVYGLIMHISHSEHAGKSSLDKTFFEFVDSFRFT
ncbi:MAG: hypothetical protein WBP22_02560 [Candidatus Saccharimonas sp.]